MLRLLFIFTCLILAVQSFPTGPLEDPFERYLRRSSPPPSVFFVDDKTKIAHGAGSNRDGTFYIDGSMFIKAIASNSYLLLI